MKLTNLFNLTVLGLVLTMTAVGCKTQPYQPKVIPGNARPPVDVGNMGNIGRGAPIGGTGGIGSRPVDTGGGIPPNPGERIGWIENTAALKAQTVYFDFDKSAIKTKEQSKLQEVGNYLKSNPRAAVRVEGNCDERGTEEYNRSLGERRALAAREYLVNLGIDPTRVDTVTNGEDKPAVQGHDEAAWSKNRRDEFVVLTPPR